MGEKKEKRGLLERLREGPVVGDGSMVVVMEKRGYVLAGHWTPEAVIEYPDAVRELSMEYLRAGSDVIQSMTFNGGNDLLKNDYKVDDINEAGCRIASEVASKGQALVAGTVSPTDTFRNGQRNKEAVQEEMRLQCRAFSNNRVDFIIAEFFNNIIEVEYITEVLKEHSTVPLVVSMNIGPPGDGDGIPPAECALRMAKTGADVIGVNCRFDPDTCLEVIKIMKAALDEEGLAPYLVVQPVGFNVPEVRNVQQGYTTLPEHPLALEPRLLTRWEARRFAREAYEAGVRYIGGCCGFEPHHIREIAEELAVERGVRPPGQDKNEQFGAALTAAENQSRVRRGRDYWMNLKRGNEQGGQ